MNAHTPPLITADAAAFKTLYPKRPFRIRHAMSGDPRLKLPAILELVKSLPRDHIEYNSGKVGVSQDAASTPLVDLTPEEVVAKIESAGAWMVLKRIEHNPAYRKMLEDALLSVATAQGFASLAEAGYTDVQGFLFVSSPGSTTPFHLDSEDNFFVQIHGDKQFSIYDNEDRGIADEDLIEHAITKHRNIPYKDAFEPRAMHNALKPGEGVFVPYLWPHWIKTFDSYSISVAITWKTRAVNRRNALYQVNSMLRDRGRPQAAPGVKPGWDATKLALYGTMNAVLSPLRKSEGFRRFLRGLVRGKDANYYYRDSKKTGGGM